MSSTINIAADPERIKRHWSAKYAGENPTSEIIAQAEIFGDELDQAWKQSQETILSTIERITGLPVVGEFTVFVLPPELQEAQYLDATTIEWGYAEAYENSMVIGIAHELIHCVTHDFYSPLSDDEKWIFHALVYLSADEEVRFALNGRSEYFDLPTIGDYHERLIKTAKMILPLWKEHLENSQRSSLIAFFHELSNKVD